MTRYVVGTGPTAVTVHHDRDAHALAERLAAALHGNVRIIITGPDAVDIIDGDTFQTLVEVRPK